MFWTVLRLLPGGIVFFSGLFSAASERVRTGKGKIMRSCRSEGRGGGGFDEGAGEYFPCRWYGAEPPQKGIFSGGNGIPPVPPQRGLWRIRDSSGVAALVWGLAATAVAAVLADMAPFLEGHFCTAFGAGGILEIHVGM